MEPLEPSILAGNGVEPEEAVLNFCAIRADVLHGARADAAGNQGQILQSTPPLLQRVEHEVVPNHASTRHHIHRVAVVGEDRGAADGQPQDPPRPRCREQHVGTAAERQDGCLGGLGLSEHGADLVIRADRPLGGGCGRHREGGGDVRRGGGEGGWGEGSLAWEESIPHNLCPFERLGKGPRIGPNRVQHSRIFRRRQRIRQPNLLRIRHRMRLQPLPTLAQRLVLHPAIRRLHNPPMVQWRVQNELWEAQGCYGLTLLLFFQH